MRSRAKIEKDAEDDSSLGSLGKLILETLLDMREIMIRREKDLE